MDIPITNDLINICGEIAAKKLTITEWKDIESCDMFQSPDYCGGFDADECQFCFSYFDKNKSEFWFHFTVSNAEKIANGIQIKLNGRPANGL
jgi:hypothetical protein